MRSLRSVSALSLSAAFPDLGPRLCDIASRTLASILFLSLTCFLTMLPVVWQIRFGAQSAQLGLPLVGTLPTAFGPWSLIQPLGGPFPGREVKGSGILSPGGAAHMRGSVEECLPCLLKGMRFCLPCEQPGCGFPRNKFVSQIKEEQLAFAASGSCRLPCLYLPVR